MKSGIDNYLIFETHAVSVSEPLAWIINHCYFGHVSLWLIIGCDKRESFKNNLIAELMLCLEKKPDFRWYTVPSWKTKCATNDSFHFPLIPLIMPVVQIRAVHQSFMMQSMCMSFVGNYSLCFFLMVKLRPRCSVRDMLCYTVPHLVLELQNRQDWQIYN